MLLLLQLRCCFGLVGRWLGRVVRMGMLLLRMGSMRMGIVLLRVVMVWRRRRRTVIMMEMRSVGI